MLEVRNLTKVYTPKKGAPVRALDNVSLIFEETGMVFILGKSGSGKSTMLNLMGGLDSITSGEIIVKGKSGKDFTQADFDSYRNTFIGFIFQEYNILNEFTVGQNISLALELQGKKYDHAAVEEILEQVDLKGYSQRKPGELSGGQKQRVAIARALIKDPEIIMADEPTGALDSATGRQVFETLQKLSKNKLVIIISHDREYAEFYGDRVIEFSDGHVISDIKKYKSDAETVGDGISVIDNSILHVKSGHKFSAAEKTAILDFLENAPGEIILSKDERSNTNFRQQARIDENGVKESFEKTDGSNTVIKSYNPADFKMIRSRLPFKHSLKMGASGLKVKPVRLFLTILLSAIAFGLFGLADTLGAYSKYETAYKSFKESDIDYASFSKSHIVRENDYSYTYSANLTDSDFDMIKQKFPDYKFSKAYNLGIDFSYFLYKQAGGYLSPYMTSFQSMMETSAEKLESLGYTITGNFPSSLNEIAITKYAYDSFKDLGFVNPDVSPDKITISSETDLIGKTLKYGDYVFKITAVIDTKMDMSRYQRLYDLTDNAEFNLMDYLLAQELYALREYSYHGLLYTTEGFYELYNTQNNFFNFYDYKYYVTGYSSSTNLGVGYYNGMQYSDNLNPYFFDNTQTSLNKDEVIISVYDLYNYYNLYYRNYDSEIKARIDSDIYQKICEPAVRTKLKTVLTRFYRTNLGLGQADAETAADDTLATIDTDRSFAGYDYMLGNDITVFGMSYYSYYSSLEIPRAVELLGEKSSDFSANKNNLMQRLSFDHFNDNTKSFNADVKIAGVCVSDYFSALVLHQDNITEYLGEIGKIKFAITQFKDNKSSDMKLIYFSYDETGDICFPLRNTVTYTLENINFIIEKLADIFLYIGIGFAVFAAFLLMNFISTSISYKKSEIGILRAVGAKSSDVFGIFFNESAIIAFISFTVSFIGALIGCFFLNRMLRQEAGLLLTILNIGIRQFALMLGVSIFTAAIASFVPVYRIASKKPIDAIRK